MVLILVKTGKLSEKQKKVQARKFIFLCTKNREYGVWRINATVCLTGQAKGNGTWLQPLPALARACDGWKASLTLPCSSAFLHCLALSSSSPQMSCSQPTAHTTSLHPLFPAVEVLFPCCSDASVIFLLLTVPHSLSRVKAYPERGIWGFNCTFVWISLLSISTSILPYSSHL